jgi:rhamnulokinase
MSSPLYIAVDLGAGSGRVFLAGVGQAEFLLEEIHRFQNLPREQAGHLRWNFTEMFAEIKLGLKAAGVRARMRGRQIQSIGVDSWGVDYGLLDAGGKLLADPVCYRDDRTKNVMEQVFDTVPRDEIFKKTGIQFQNFNTLYQLYSEEGSGDAADLLLLPDLVNYFLTGRKVAEYTNATTMQMLNVASSGWDVDLLVRLDLPAGILQKVVPAGTDLGLLRAEIAAELGLAGVSVIAPATHDTASAVAGAPLSENASYISSGTWSLVGIERKDALTGAEAARQNFTNEGGVYGTIRFLKNVMGLWIFESCRREWKATGIDVEYQAIISDISKIKDFTAFIFPDDERFMNPRSMIEAIRQQLNETGQEFDETPAAISKIIFDSLAFRYASVLRAIELLTNSRLEGIHILGGGGRNEYLTQMTANASGLMTTAGLTEATVVGNVLVQAITAGRFSSISDARDHVRANFELKNFDPKPSLEIDEAANRYASVEKRFVV